MQLKELFKIAIRSIQANKVRSLLTMLGLIIGISSVVAILSIGTGTQNSIAGSLGSLGVNNITINENRDETLMPSERLDTEDVEALKAAFPELIAAIVPKVNAMAKIQQNIDASTVQLSGANEDVESIDTLEINEGRFITQQDVITKKSVVVIDSDLGKTLYEKDSPVGKTLTVESGAKATTYTIVGVYNKEESSLGASNSMVYLPYSTLDKQFNLKGDISGISIAMANSETIEADANRMIAYLERLHHNENKNKYEYFSLGSMVDTVSDTLGMVTMLISAVAAISLVVGGIGVMNIMLVSVTERTREIGIRKALGAKRKDILLQFLVEAVIICLIGGVIGVGFGYVFTEIAEILFKTPMSISMFSITLSTVFSTMMGIIFGVYPANKASKLDPIESLRYE